MVFMSCLYTYFVQPWSVTQPNSAFEEYKYQVRPTHLKLVDRLVREPLADRENGGTGAGESHYYIIRPFPFHALREVAVIYIDTGLLSSKYSHSMYGILLGCKSQCAPLAEGYEGAQFDFAGDMIPFVVQPRQ